MNQASDYFGLGFYVYQRNYDWFVDKGGITYKFTGSTLTIPR